MAEEEDQLISDLVDLDECLWCCQTGCRDSVCPKCGLVSYCSEPHLQNHYGPEGQCLPFRIRYCREKGRYAEAIRTIKPTELIVSDRPLVVGPSRQQQVVCVECLQPVDGSITCEKCHLPLCQPDCAKSSKAQWHCGLECNLLASNGFKAANKAQKANSSTASTEVPPLLVQLASITPCRLLLKGLRSDTYYHDLNTDAPLYTFYSTPLESSKNLAFETDMVDMIWQDFGLSKQLASKEVVRTAVGQLFNNAKSLESPGHNGSGLYGRYCMLNHCCVANAKCIIKEQCGGGAKEFPLDVRAQTTIERGEEITTRYVGINIGLPLRGEMLREHWSFTCQCKRCSDPTELGTYASAVWCYNCKATASSSSNNNTGSDIDKATAGVMLPKGQAADVATTVWSCTQCGTSIDKAKMESFLDIALRIIKNNTSDPPEVKLLEHVIKELTLVFHYKHYLVMQVRFVLFKLLVAQSSDESSTIQDWDKLTALALELLDTLSRLDPGASRNRGKVLKDLIKPFMKLAELELQTQKIDAEAYAKRKNMAKEYAKDLIMCYRYESIQNIR